MHAVSLKDRRSDPSDIRVKAAKSKDFMKPVLKEPYLASEHHLKIFLGVNIGVSLDMIDALY